MEVDSVLPANPAASSNAVLNRSPEPHVHTTESAARGVPRPDNTSVVGGDHDLAIESHSDAFADGRRWWVVGLRDRGDLIEAERGCLEVPWFDPCVGSLAIDGDDSDWPCSQLTRRQHQQKATWSEAEGEAVDHDFHPTVLLPSIGCGVVRHRLGLAPADRGDTVRIDALVDIERLHCVHPGL